MHIKDLYAIVVTEKRAECRNFYVRWFGFQVVFEASWFVYLSATGDHPFGLAFMAPDHPSQPPGRDAFNGKGLLLTLQVEDATVEFERLKGGGLEIAYPLHDEPWGQRRFAVYDPPEPGSMSFNRSTRRRASGKSTHLERAVQHHA